MGLFSDDVSSDVAGDVAKLTWHRERATAAGIGPRGTNPSDCLNPGNSYSITY